MADIWVPSRSRLAKALREPGLLVPRTKPTGSVKIDWTHPYAKDLIIAVVPIGGRLMDLVSGSFLSTAGTVVTDLRGNEHYVIDCQTGGASLANLQADAQGGTGITVTGRVNYDTILQDHTLFNYQSSAGVAHFWADTYAGQLRPGIHTGAAVYGGAMSSSDWIDWGGSVSTSSGYLMVNAAVAATGITLGSGLGTINTTSSGMFQQDAAGSAKQSDAQYSYIFAWKGYRSPDFLIDVQTEPFLFLTASNDSPFLISVPAAGGTPTLSSPGVINVLSDRATPQVTLTF